MLTIQCLFSALSEHVLDAIVFGDGEHLMMLISF